MFDSPVKQYLLFEDFEQKVKKREMDNIPEELKGNFQARAYYGLFILGKVAISQEKWHIVTWYWRKLLSVYLNSLLMRFK